MAAFEFPSAKSNSNVAPMQGRGRNQNGEERKPVTYWANVGKNLELPVGENGEKEEVFISLGGIVFDNLETASIGPNSSTRWQIIAQAKNALIAMIQEDLKALDKGVGAYHPFLDVELRHAGEKSAVQASEDITKLVAAAMGKAA